VDHRGWSQQRTQGSLLGTLETLIHGGKIFSKLGESCNYIFATEESLSLATVCLRMRSIRILNAVCLIALLVIASFAGSYALERYRKLEVMKNSEAKAAARLMELQVATSSKRESLARLNHDPEYVERIIRQKLNYAKSGETVFKFEYETP